MNNTNKTMKQQQDKATTPELVEAPASPETRRKKNKRQTRTEDPVSSTTAVLVTPALPSKRRRLDLDEHIETPLSSRVSTPAASNVTVTPAPAVATATATPSYADLYGDDEDRNQKATLSRDPTNLPTIPRLESSFSSRHPHYRRRNSVTKFSLQAAAGRNLSVLEAAKQTLEKLEKSK